MFNFNTDSAKLLEKITMPKSRENLLENRLCATVLDLYTSMYVKLILVAL